MDSFETWWKSYEGPGESWHLCRPEARAGYIAGLRHAAEIAKDPYDDDVLAFMDDDPPEVGLKIAESIEAEAERLEKGDGQV